MKIQKPNYRVFRLAAEYQFKAMELGLDYVNHSSKASPYSCDNISDAVPAKESISSYKDYYSSLYYGDAKKCHSLSPSYLFRWWGDLENGEWDHESRIFALLLAAEILRTGGL